MASLALTSAENTAANVKSPSQGGIIFVMTVGKASSRFFKSGKRAWATIPRIAGTKANSISPTAFQFISTSRHLDLVRAFVLDLPAVFRS